MGGLTVTQLDPAVLAELPRELVSELVAGLPPSHEPFAKTGNLSPDARSSDDDDDEPAAAAASPQGSDAHAARQMHPARGSPAGARALGSPGAGAGRGPAGSGTPQQRKVR